MSGAVDPGPDNPDQGVPWHYGDPLREQRWLAAGTGVVNLGNRGVVCVAGSDRLTWLHDLTTQYLRDLAVGRSALALILDPQGHVEFELHMWDDGTTTWIITEPGAAGPLTAYLDSMRFLLDVQVADVSDDFGVIWTTLAQPEDQFGWVVPEPFAARGLIGMQRAVPRSMVGQELAAGRPCGTWALEALRVGALMPRVHCDTDSRTIPNEVGWLGSAVHLSKGCYRGQETVAKVHNLGRPPRRLGLLHCSGSSEEPLRHGEVVEHEGRVVGWVGTGAQHYEFGSVAIAMLKRSLPPQAEVTVVSGDGTRHACAQDPDLHT